MVQLQKYIIIFIVFYYDAVPRAQTHAFKRGSQALGNEYF